MSLYAELSPCPLNELMQSCVLDTRELNTCQHLSIFLKFDFLSVLLLLLIGISFACFICYVVVPIDHVVTRQKNVVKKRKGYNISQKLCITVFCWFCFFFFLSAEANVGKRLQNCHNG